MKYVILEQKEEGFSRVFPILFPEYMTHAIVAMAMIFAHKRETQREARVKSAGFCYTGHIGQWNCSVGSDSLRIPKDVNKTVQDEYILNMPEAKQGILP